MVILFRVLFFEEKKLTELLFFSPVGWVPCEEATPILNYDLIHAINKLAPGEAHELHPSTGDHPAIVVSSVLFIFFDKAF